MRKKYRATRYSCDVIRVNLAPDLGGGLESSLPRKTMKNCENPSVRQSFSKTCINAFMVLGNVDRAPGTLNILIILW